MNVIKMNVKTLAAIAWTIFIIIASIIPIPKLLIKEQDETLNFGHIFSYTILSILWIFALGFNFKALIISMALTPLTEILQLVIPWRNSNILDLRNNFLGVIIAFMILYIFKNHIS